MIPAAITLPSQAGFANPLTTYVLGGVEMAKAWGRLFESHSPDAPIGLDSISKSMDAAITPVPTVATEGPKAPLKDIFDIGGM